MKLSFTAGQQGSPVAAGTGRPTDTPAAVSIPAVCPAYHFKRDAGDPSAACRLASRGLTRRRCRLAVRASRGAAAGPRLHAAGGGSTPEVSQLFSRQDCMPLQSLHLRALGHGLKTPVLNIRNYSIYLYQANSVGSHHSAICRLF